MIPNVPESVKFGNIFFHKQFPLYDIIYRTAGFACEDFNLVVWSICNIKIKKLNLLLELFTVLMKLYQMLVVFCSLFITQHY